MRNKPASHPNIFFLLLTILLISCNGNKSVEHWDPVNAPIKGERVLEMTSPPNVPESNDSREHALKQIVNMEVIEKQGRLADGVQYTFWTFGGDVPGKFIRVREGDLIEFHLKNHPDNKFAHNIDMHAVTGPGGGATSSFTAPGHETVFSFRAIRTGLFVYHCATAPVGMHIANGMYGLILVEPREGLSKVDREYYVMQGDFYTNGRYGEGGLQAFSMDKALKEEPEYVVFNGSVGSLTGDNALQAKVGEKIRLFIGNGGPNLVSSFHVIGEIFDNVYQEAGTEVNHNVQTTLIPSGGAAIAEFKVEVPGTFILVDHSIFRAFNKGALAQLKVEGEEDPNIYSGKQSENVYLGEGGHIQEIPESGEPAEKATTLEEKLKKGSIVFQSVCQACHQSEGQGLPGAFPPLAKSDYFKNDISKIIGPVVHGLTGEIIVNGQKFNSIMPKQTLTDEEIANVTTFVLNNFGNGGGEITSEMVRKNR